MREGRGTCWDRVFIQPWSDSNRLKVPSNIQIYIAVATTLGVLLTGETLRRRTMDVTPNETRIRDTFVSKTVNGYWEIKPQVVQVRAENYSMVDFFKNIVRKHPSGRTDLELHVRADTNGIWSREDFKEVCESFNVGASFEIRENNPSQLIVDTSINSTDPHIVVDFVRALAEDAPRAAEGKREEQVAITSDEIS